MSIQGEGKHGGARHAIPYDQAIADEVCHRIAEGEGLEAICRDPHIPSERQLRSWMAIESIFNQAYTRAREFQMERWADDIVRIADDTSGDTMEVAGKNGAIERVVDQENIQRARLRIETRKWIMSKLAPRYADKVDVSVDAKIRVETMSDTELEDRTRARLLALGIDMPARLRCCLAPLARSPWSQSLSLAMMTRNLRTIVSSAFALQDHSLDYVVVTRAYPPSVLNMVLSLRPWCIYGVC